MNYGFKLRITIYPGATLANNAVPASHLPGLTMLLLTSIDERELTSASVGQSKSGIRSQYRCSMYVRAMRPRIDRADPSSFPLTAPREEK